MGIYLDNEDLCCTICGRCGVTTKTCPNLSHRKCTYCKQNTHYIQDCPEIEPCEICKKKGHKTEDCRNKQSELPGWRGQIASTSSATTPGRKRKRHAESIYQPESNVGSSDKGSSETANEGTIITSIKPPAHDAEDWLAFSEKIREVI